MNNRVDYDFAQILDMAIPISSPCLNWNDFEPFLNRMSEAVSAFITRQLNSFDTNIKRVFFGAGGHGQYLLKHCRALGIPPDYFCDNDIESFQWLGNTIKKQHTTIDGLFVLAPSDLMDINNSQIVVATDIPRFRKAITAQLMEMGAPIMPGPECFLYEAIIINSYIRFYLENLENLKQTCQALDDDRSRFIYLSVLKGRIVPYCDSEIICGSMVEGGQYWALNEFKNLKDTVFVDAGACAGDTVKTFIRNNIASGFEKIYAFEPDESLFLAMCDNSRHLSRYYQFDFQKIEPVKGAVGCKPDRAPSVLTAETSRQEPLSKPQTMPLFSCELTYALDDYLNGRPVGFIKADIEGYEQDLICGAEQLIQKYRPHLAICIYHLPTDIFAIPLHLKRLVPEYKMAVRHHAPELSETVLYCWV